MMYVCPFTESSLYKVVTTNYTRSLFGSAVVIVGCNKQQLLLHFIYSKDYWIALRMGNLNNKAILHGKKSGVVIVGSTLKLAVLIFQWSMCLSVENTLLVR